MICVFLFTYMTCIPVLANDTAQTQVPLKIEQTGETGHYVFESMKSGNPMPEGASNTYSFEILKGQKTLFINFTTPGIYEYKIRQIEKPEKEYNINIIVKNGSNDVLIPEIVVSDNYNQKVSSIRFTNEKKERVEKKATTSTDTGVRVDVDVYTILIIVCIMGLILLWVKQKI